MSMNEADLDAIDVQLQEWEAEVDTVGMTPQEVAGVVKMAGQALAAAIRGEPMPDVPKAEGTTT